MRCVCHAKVIPFRTDIGKEVSISAAPLETFRRARTFLTTLREDLFKASQSRSSSHLLNTACAYFAASNKMALRRQGALALTCTT
jgi:hypothetical protein